jgi:adenine-specific DNA-methyltransferase
LRVRDEVTAEKLRGGFYSPQTLVERCLDRAAELLGGRGELRILEPSAGNGAFLRGLARHGLRANIARVDAVELVADEAASCRAALDDLGVEGEVVEGSFLDWAIGHRGYDVALGNPPFVRYQFVSASDQRALPAIEGQLGLSLAGVSNLWIPILLGSLDILAPGGVFAFIVPSECFTGVSARTVRQWLASNVEDLRVDLFPVGSFPSVLQEVVVLSGRRVPEPTPITGRLEVREHFSDGRSLGWIAPLDDQPTWTRHLLEPVHREALSTAARLPVVNELGSVVRFGVATVTGANDYFCVDQATLDGYGLAAWSLPLLPRIRHAPGLVYRSSDQAQTVAAGAKGYLLDFSLSRPDPVETIGPALYLGLGTAAAIDRRYKTRIRDPWYRVPVVRPGELLLSKRAHRFPRVVLNEAGVVTTDTIYRGAMRPDHAGRQRDVVAAFHNSLTLLTAEVEGRSFGGGVLELVPSEIARLRVPVPEGFGVHADELDGLARKINLTSDGEELVDLTDTLLVRADVGLTRELVATLREARMALVRRRFDRN